MNLEKPMEQKVLELKSAITELWNVNAQCLSPDRIQENVIPTLTRFLQVLETGEVCVMLPPQGDSLTWNVQTWVKEGILLMFRFFPAHDLSGGTGQWWDKIPLRTFFAEALTAQAIRILPGAWIRRGSYIGPKTVFMSNSFVNLGAHLGEGTMVDSGVTVGSCAYVGKACHLSANVLIGGVLEPIQDRPTVIEDNVFVGAGCQVVEGVHLGQGCVIASGTTLTASTKIVNRATGAVTYGYIPPYSVVVPGTIASPRFAGSLDSVALQCAVIIKTVDAGTRAKTSLNQLLRGE